MHVYHIVFIIQITHVHKKVSEQFFTPNFYKSLNSIALFYWSRVFHFNFLSFFQEFNLHLETGTLNFLIVTHTIYISASSPVRIFTTGFWFRKKKMVLV